MRTNLARKGVRQAVTVRAGVPGGRGRGRLAWQRLVAALLAVCLGWYGGGMCLAAAAPPRGTVPAAPPSRRAPLPMFPFDRMAVRSLPPRSGGGGPAPTAVSLLDALGNLNGPITSAQEASWRAELHRTGLDPRRAAQLQLWLGEWTLAHDQQPGAARDRFGLVSRHVGAHDPLGSLAAYDSALALYDAGAYADAADAFAGLFGPGARPGYDARKASLWLRMARTCAGYHGARSRQGIPEPPRLDPLCGAAALAACLRALGLPSGRARVLASCRVTGEGSTLDDLLRAGPRLGADVQALNADEAGLEAMPKPAVAYVEHDHFIAVVRADRKGVSYLCSDCGAWPGGRVDLTWRQWRLLDPGLYVAVTRPGSAGERRVAQALGASAWAPGCNVATANGESSFSPAPVRVAMRGNVPALHVGVHYGPGPALLGHAVRYIGSGGVSCGNKPTTLQGNCLQSMPTDTGTPGTDPVNLANGEEEFTPSADLVVANPLGPPVVWQRVYDSLRPTGAGYSPGDATDEDLDYGVGWTQQYNVGVYDPSGGTGTGSASPKFLYLPNGARMAFYAPSVPTSAAPTVYCVVALGVPIRVTWNYAAAGDYFVVTFKNRSRWITGALNTAKDPVSGGAIDCAPLAQITDRNGNSLFFQYGSQPVDGWNLLASVSNGKTTLLSIQRAANGSVQSVTDVNNRTVVYNVQLVKTVDNVNSYNPYFQELEEVSQVFASGGQTAVDAEKYGYTNVANGDGGEAMPFLSTVSEPTPDGQTEPPGSVPGMTTATINYAPVTGYVTSLVDAKGNTRTYTATDGTSTKVAVTNASGALVNTYTVHFNAAMQWVSTIRGDARTLFTADYPSGAPDPFHPYKVTDGVGGTWRYTWDRYGNLMRVTTSYNAQIDLVWAFPTGNDPAATVPSGQTGVPDMVAGYDSGTINTTTTADTGCPMGELVSVTETNETANIQKAATTYGYDASGNLTKVTAPPPDTFSTAGSPNQATPVTYSFQYGPGGVLSQASAPAPNSSGTLTTTFDYTNSPQLGVPTTVTDPLKYPTAYGYNARGDLLSVQDANGHTTTFTYNLADQPLTATLPATGQTGAGQARTQVTYLYYGGPATQAQVFDESGSTTALRTSTFTYSATGELASEGGSAEALAVTYDALHRPLTVGDGNSHVTTYVYDPNSGGLSSVSYPDANAATGYDTQTFAGYNGNGDPATSMDGRGVTTSYAYNGPGGALTGATTTSSGSVAARAVSIAYDGFGRVASVGDGSAVSRAYTYDDDDDVLSAATTYNGGPSATLAYRHYPDGSRRSMSVSGSGTQSPGPYTYAFSYGYDGDGRLNSVTDPAQASSSWTYQNNGWPATQTLGNGATSVYSFNAAGQLTDLTTQAAPSSSTVLSEFGPIKYDGAGNMLSVQKKNGSAFTTAYGYNALDRLTSETNSPATYPALGTMSYDGAGNRSGPGYNADNQSAANAYDGEGNPTSYGGQALAFDAADQMTSFGSVLSASYAPDGLRASKQSSAGKTYYFYDGSQPVLEADGTGNALALNTFGGGLLSRYAPAAGASTFYTFDERGNVAQRLNASGMVLSSDVYNAYGQLLTAGGTGGSPGTNGAQPAQPQAADVFGFGAQAGYRTDSETGLCLLGLRYYDPAAGRFLNRDPLGYAGGMDLYAYCGDNPVNRMDPSGLRDTEYDGIHDDGDSSVSNAETSSAGMMSQRDPGMQQAGLDAASCLLHQVPVLGAGLSANDAVTGCDAISGRGQSPLQRVMSAGEAALGLLGMLGGDEEALAAGCGCGGGMCLVAGTPVWMADGSQRPIEGVQAGDQVLSRDPATGRDSVRTVTATVQRPADALVTLSLADPSSGKAETLTCTPDHPLYVTGQGWVEAGGLGIGTSIVTRAGHALTVQDIQWQRAEDGGKPFTVYNLTVQDDHTYFAGELDGGLWAHNSCSSNARALRRNMEAVGRRAGKGDAAHHIVASGDSRAALSVAVLRREGIDINDADNGVFLPENGSIPSAGMIPHSQIHRNLYHQNVENALLGAAPGTVRAVLQDIGSQISRGTFPYR